MIILRFVCQMLKNEIEINILVILLQVFVNCVQSDIDIKLVFDDCCCLEDNVKERKSQKERERMRKKRKGKERKKQLVCDC